MKRKAFLLIAMMTLIICALTVVSYADGTEVDSYYLVQNADSEAAFVLQAEGKTNIVTVAEITSYVSVNNGESTSVLYLQSTQKASNLSVVTYNTIPKEKETE